jgi:hypothetical protein
MYHPFSITQTISTSWTVLKKNFITLIVYSIVSLVFYGVVDFFNNFIFVADDKRSLFVVILIQIILQAYLALSFYKLILTLIDKEFYEFSFRDILPSVKMTLNFVIIAFLSGILIFLFLLINLVLLKFFGTSIIFQIDKLSDYQILELLVVLYLMSRSIFCVCFIVDDDSGPFESLKRSFEITRDNFFKTLGIYIIILLILFIALIPVFLIINIFDLDKPDHSYVFILAFYCWFLLTFPFIQVIIMVTYRKLVYSHLDVDDDDITDTV